MASSLAGTATLSFNFGYGIAKDLETVNSLLNRDNSPTSYTFGSGSYQANALFTDTRTLAATNESFDLNAAAISDAFGSTLTLLAVKLLYVRNKSTTTAQRLTLTGDFLGGVATSPCFGATTPTINIGPAGWFAMESPIDGFLVTSTTSDVLTVTNTASFDYDIIILGIV